jgi:ABC-type dipeptide/oligopeptide/nickel transport system permease subunit
MPEASQESLVDAYAARAAETYGSAGESRAAPATAASAPRRFGTLPMVGLAVFTVLLVAGLVAPLLPIANPLAQTLTLRNAAPSAHHLLGTDQGHLESDHLRLPLRL